MDPGALQVTLALTALLVGATGTWSPCGLSMIETIAPSGNSGSRRVTYAACLTFLPGAMVGGAVTFGLLALLGAGLQGKSQPLAYGLGVAVALAAAIAEARGTVIVPQIRRQVPEHWRRVMPMPVAAALYGVLLGLGFTTFVLSFGVWALAALALLVADPALGALIGVCFGIGRAVPIVAIGLIVDRRVGRGALDAMTMRPGIYRGARAGDALALVAVALALVTSDALAASRDVDLEVKRGADPSVAADDMVFQGPHGDGFLVRGPHRESLPGRQPAIGGPYVAIANSNGVTLLDRGTLAPLGSFVTSRVDALAVESAWVIYRRREDGIDLLLARAINTAGTSFGDPILVARSDRASQLGRPALSAGRVYYVRSRPRTNALVRHAIADDETTTLERSNRVALSNPAVAGKRLAYVVRSRRHQWVRLRRVGGGHAARTIYSLPGHRRQIWSTALTADRLYLTVLSRSGASKLLSSGY